MKNDQLMRARSRPLSKPSLALALLIGLGLVLWIGGGASRADMPGQIVTRVGAWATILTMILFADRPRLGEARTVGLFLLAALLLALLQLVPLPPALWQSMPGRAALEGAAQVAGSPQPWRPWSIVPGTTINAASSLIVPAAVLLLMAGLKPTERPRVPVMLLWLIILSALIGLLQFSGFGFDNPLVNDTPGEASGLFANRNHFALFVAMGCVIAPAWAFQGARSPRWRAPVALGLIPFFALIILASGSRAGLIVGGIAIALGLVLSWGGIRKELRRYPRWAAPALAAGIVGMTAVTILLSVAAGRAVSIERALTIDPGQDIRHLGLPTVLRMIKEYFPFGSGLGSFDPVFRIHEPFDLLRLTYFNHAHNDFLEIVLDAGLLGLLLLSAGLLWWAGASLRVWRKSGSEYALPKLGSAILLLIIIASAFDYPARTPIIMATMILAALWLSEGKARSSSPLPAQDQHL